MRNSIFANSGGDNDCTSIGVFEDFGHNLMENSSDSCPLSPANGNIVGSDPRLGPLQDNGGPTLTHAPLGDSPVINAGSTELTTDQRGSTRPFGPAADIGAVERKNFNYLPIFFK